MEDRNMSKDNIGFLFMTEFMGDRNMSDKRSSPDKNSSKAKRYRRDIFTVAPTDKQAQYDYEDSWNMFEEKLEAEAALGAVALSLIDQKNRSLFIEVERVKEVEATLEAEITRSKNNNLHLTPPDLNTAILSPMPTPLSQIGILSSIPPPRLSPIYSQLLNFSANVDLYIDSVVEGLRSIDTQPESIKEPKSAQVNELKLKQVIRDKRFSLVFHRAKHEINVGISLFSKPNSYTDRIPIYIQRVLNL